MTLKTISILTSTLALVTACGASTSEEGATMSISLAMKSGEDDSVGDEDDVDASEGDDSKAIVATSQNGDDLTIESAFVYVRHIELELPEGTDCDDDDDDDRVEDDDHDEDDDHGESESDDDSSRCEDGKIVLDGPWVFDLMTGQSTPSLEEVVVPAGVYERVDIRLDDAEDELPEGAPSDLAGFTIIASGSYAGPGAERFELALKFNEDARFESKEGFEIAAGTAGDLALKLDVAGWMRGLPLADCLEDDDLEVKDGVLQLNDGSGSCSDIENHLKDQIKNSAQFD